MIGSRCGRVEGRGGGGVAWRDLRTGLRLAGRRVCNVEWYVVGILRDQRRSVVMLSRRKT